MGSSLGRQISLSRPIIDIAAASDTELDTIEPVEATLVVDSSPLIPTILPQTRRISERDTDSQSDTQSELPLAEVVTRPSSSAAVSENGSLREVARDSDDDIEGSDSHSRNTHLSLKSSFVSPNLNFAPFQVDPLSKFMPFVEEK